MGREDQEVFWGKEELFPFILCKPFTVQFKRVLEQTGGHACAVSSASYRGYSCSKVERWKGRWPKPECWCAAPACPWKEIRIWHKSDPYPAPAPLLFSAPLPFLLLGLLGLITESDQEVGSIFVTDLSYFPFQTTHNVCKEEVLLSVSLCYLHVIAFLKMKQHVGILFLAVQKTFQYQNT